MTTSSLHISSPRLRAFFWPLVAAAVAACSPGFEEHDGGADGARAEAAVPDVTVNDSGHPGVDVAGVDAAGADDGGGGVPDSSLPPGCPDGTCTDGETCASCPADCGGCPAECGDASCDENEDCTSCPQDCGDCTATCGDERCDLDESCAGCAADCGSCDCQPGYELDGRICTPRGPAALTGRSSEEICGRWRMDFITVSPEWQPTPGSTDSCDPGTLLQTAQDNAMRRVNLYRWLVGVNPVVEYTAGLDNLQACAVLQYGMGSLSHDPPVDAPCYTSQGASAAGSANIAGGARELAHAVDMFVGDVGVASLGHRRWTLNTYSSTTGFGYRPNYACMYAWSQGGSSDVDLVAWPPPGHVPVQAAEGVWSFASNVYRPTASTRMEVAIGDSAPEEVEYYVLENMGVYGPTLAFSPPVAPFQPGAWRIDQTVRVMLYDTAAGDIDYTVHFVDCEP